MDSQSDSESETVSCIKVYATGTNKAKPLFAEMQIKNEPVKFQIDSGTTVNVIPEKFVPKEDKIVRENITLKVYNQTCIQTEGRARDVRYFFLLA